jgi:hypothetical protein
LNKRRKEKDVAEDPLKWFHITAADNGDEILGPKDTRKEQQVCERRNGFLGPGTVSFTLLNQSPC